MLLCSICPCKDYFILSYLNKFSLRNAFSAIIHTFFTVHALNSNFHDGFNSRLDAVNCKRVNVAGSQAASYLQRLLQLKYPGHLAAVTLSRVEELLHEHSYTAVDYHEGTVH